MHVNWRRPTWRSPDDRGAVATVFTLLLAGGVLLGVMALVVDVGQIYVERSELQSGADAAALGVARACATDAPECTPSGVRAIAERYANDNASDRVSGVAEVCGRRPGVLLECNADPANLTACLGSPPPVEEYVEVRVSTLLPDGSLVLPPAFAQGVSPDFDGVSVGACARASWAPSALTILAVSATICQFNDATANGGRFGDASDPDADDEYVIQFWTGSIDDECDPDPEPPWQNPDQAGFLDGGGALCQIGVSNDGVVSGSFIGFEPFDLAPASCESRVRQARANGEVIYLPIHDGRVGGDTSPQFRHVFVAPLLVTGFQFGAPPSADPPYDGEAHREPSRLTGHPCDIPRYRCLSGLFVGEPIPIANLVGETQIRLIG